MEHFKNEEIQSSDYNHIYSAYIGKQFSAFITPALSQRMAMVQLRQALYLIINNEKIKKQKSKKVNHEFTVLLSVLNETDKEYLVFAKIINDFIEYFNAQLTQTSIQKHWLDQLERIALLIELRRQIILLEMMVAVGDSGLGAEQLDAYTQVVTKYQALFQTLIDDNKLPPGTFSEIATYFIIEAEKTVANPNRSADEIIISARKFGYKLYKLFGEDAGQPRHSTLRLAIYVTIGALIGAALGVVIGGGIGFLAGNVGGAIAGAGLGALFGLCAGVYLGAKVYDWTHASSREKYNIRQNSWGLYTQVQELQELLP
jgi:hypothetical protein